MAAKLSITDIIQTATHDERGKRKSALLLYSFFFAFVVLFLQVLSFSLLLGFLDVRTATLPLFLRNVTEALVPSLLTVLVLLLLEPLMKEKRLVLSSYLWLLGFAFLAFLSLLFLTRDDKEVQKIAFNYSTGMMLVPASLGTLLAWLQYYLNTRRNRA